MPPLSLKEKLEYAYIRYLPAVGGRLTLTYLHSDGPKTNFEKGDSVTSDLSGQLLGWITQLGQEGYEMIAYSTTSLSIPKEEYWFKRPL